MCVQNLDSLNEFKKGVIIIDSRYTLPILVVPGNPSGKYYRKILVIYSAIPIEANITSYLEHLPRKWQRHSSGWEYKLDTPTPNAHLDMNFKCTFFISLGAHNLQYIPRNMHTVFALLCFVVVIHWLIFPYPSGLLHWHCGNLTIAPVPAKQPWWIWINTSCEFIMNDCITTTKQSTTKPCAYFLGYTVHRHKVCLKYC